MHNDPGKTYFDRLSSELDFNRDPLEKAYRLVELSKEIHAIKDLKGKLALKGGTALQFIFFDLNRLSVDIDLNYIGSVDKDAAQEDRDKIREILTKLFTQYGYETEPNKWYSEEQFELSYINSVGNKDRVKVEINYSERLPVLTPITLSFKHPFEVLGSVKALTYPFEESMGMKTRALLTRGTPRDLFDIYLFATQEMAFDTDLYRKITLFYLCCSPIDARGVSIEKIRSLDDLSLKRHLLPMLRRRDHHWDLDSMKETVRGFLDKHLKYNDDEQEFLKVFYEKNKFEKDLLFGNTPVNPNLAQHPVVIWRLETR